MDGWWHKTAGRQAARQTDKRMVELIFLFETMSLEKDPQFQVLVNV